MAARASSLALLVLLALCLVPHAVSRMNRGAVAELEATSSSSSPVSSGHGHGYPCDAAVGVRVPHDRICDRDRCGALCVELFMWKYPDIKAAFGDCPPEDPHKCICSFFC
nr:uncharacterized protein LOC127298190 [Lolium perenne]